MCPESLILFVIMEMGDRIQAKKWGRVNSHGDTMQMAKEVHGSHFLTVTVFLGCLMDGLCRCLALVQIVA